MKESLAKNLNAMENAALCRDAAAMPGRGASHFLAILIKVKVRLLHRGAMPEGSRGLSGQRYLLSALRAGGTTSLLARK
jgi:hypothetical protein